VSGGGEAGGSVIRSLPANAITVGSAGCGFLAMALVARGQHAEAAWWILLGNVLDGMDGKVARALNAASRFGLALDSFADFLVFGVAPAFLVLGVGGGLAETPAALGVVGAAAYALAAIVRVSRYTSSEADAFPGLFRGLPMPVASSLICATVAWEQGPAAPRLAEVVPGLAGVLAVAMVSRAFFVPREWAVGGRAWRAFSLASFGWLILAILTRSAPESILALVVVWWGWGGWLATRAARAQPTVST
jgi:CDP-diacylglycerol--serine O-phosphatidyltransferase